MKKNRVIKGSVRKQSTLMERAGITAQNVLALFQSSQVDSAFSEEAPARPRTKKRGASGGTSTELLGLRDMLNTFGGGSGEKRALLHVLDDLAAQGKIVRLKGQRYTLPGSLEGVRGHLSIQRQGMGFVTPLKGKGADIYVHPSQLGGAWDGDTVQVALLPGRSGKSAEGRVLHVLDRPARELLVTLLPEMVKEGGVVKRLARALEGSALRFGGYILVDCSGLQAGAAPDAVPPLHNGKDDLPSPGTVLLVRTSGGPQPKDGVTRAEAMSFLDDFDSVPSFERLVKAEHAIPVAFPAAVMEAARALPEKTSPEDITCRPYGSGNFARGERRDLSALPFVTIDGADAKDFDDAVNVERSGQGFILRVAIADVSHYVRQGDVLDIEARERGNSYYFPASVEPMLPEALSNDLCSLRPRVPRLVMIAELQLDEAGNVNGTEFYPGLLTSRARLTYEQVETFLHPYKALAESQAPAGTMSDSIFRTGLPPDDPASLPADVVPMLRCAQELAGLLMKRRAERGALDFDLPEPVVLLDDHGGVSGMVFRQRLFSHRLIEEFMITANEAVAGHLARFESKGLYFLYRTHAAPDPEKLAEFYKTLEAAGVRVPKEKRQVSPEPQELRDLLVRCAALPGEYALNRLLLRSMMQARYSPEPEGHFGLASPAYCHFTSPIRRYADLTVHRALKKSLGMDERVEGEAALAVIADGLNVTERSGVEAERDIHKICAALFMRGKEGEIFEGVVSGLTAFGIFIELADFPVEGLMRLENLSDDYYVYDPDRQLIMGDGTGRLFRVGQTLRVRLEHADPMLRRIDFVPETMPHVPGAKNGRNEKKRGAVKKSGKRQAGRLAKPGKRSDAGRESAKKNARSCKKNASGKQS